MNELSISLNKYISSTGVCSRREADKWIEAGRVKINGVKAEKGNRVKEEDKVTIDGKEVQLENEIVYLAFNKPPGVTSTTDQKDKDNIIEYINYPDRVFPIGRLDKASTGLILLTNDGDIVNEILRHENNHEKEYIVTVNKPITPEFLDKMASGIPILGTKTKKCTLHKVNENTFRIILTQGLNRQIRRMCEYLGYRVKTLKRVRIMHIKLGKLALGNWRFLTGQEKQDLFRSIKK
jgi:23S rRNA pseudouridine2604 synthase